MTDKISPEDFQRIYKVVEEKGGIVLAIVFVVLLFGILLDPPLAGIKQIFSILLLVIYF